MKTREKKSYDFDLKIVLKTTILAHFEVLALQVFTKYNNFHGVC